MSPARGWHLLTAVVAAAAVVLQLVLVWQGSVILDETDPPDLGTRLVRFVSYFTILSNVLVALTCARLASGDDLSRPLWRVLRLNAVVAITVTGVVHFLLLRPLLDLEGADLLADRLLHVVVPILAVAGWLLLGPRGRVARGDLLPSAIFPAAYMVYTLVRGAIVGWYPYPFIDVTELGYPLVLANAAGVVVLMVVLTLGARALDGRLPGERTDAAQSDQGPSARR